MATATGIGRCVIRDWLRWDRRLSWFDTAKNEVEVAYMRLDLRLLCSRQKQKSYCKVVAVV